MFCAVKSERQTPCGKKRNLEFHFFPNNYVFIFFYFQWDAFCVPELNNFMLVLDREENECIEQLKYKYKVMKRLILQRMKELRQEAERQKRISVAQESVS